MAQVRITAKEVRECKACGHPKAQRTAVSGYLSDINQNIIAEVCSLCCGVLENDVLVFPLSSHTVLVGRNKANIEAAQRRHYGR